MTETEIPVLTRDDIAALRAADDVTLHVFKGRGCVRARLRGYSAQPRIYSAREQRLFPDVDAQLDWRTRDVVASHSVVGYSERASMEWSDRSDPNYYAYASFVDEAVWRTIAGVMRPGDSVHLSWIADNNCGNTREVGFHHDELRLLLTGPEGKNRRTFLARVEVGPDNTARMVQRYGPR